MKIYCFCNGGSPGWYVVMAMAEDGHVLASHVCSEEGFFKHDIGITSTWKHDIYEAHCPAGYELEWVDEPKQHEGLKAACEKNQALAAADAAK
jgi:hypothetical protein